MHICSYIESRLNLERVKKCSLENLLNGMEGRINGNIQSLKDEIAEYISELYICQKRCLKLEKDNKNLKIEITSLKKIVNNMTNREREKNLIFFNLKDDDKFNKDLLIK